MIILSAQYKPERSEPFWVVNSSYTMYNYIKVDLTECMHINFDSQAFIWPKMFEGETEGKLY